MYTTYLPSLLEASISLQTLFNIGVYRTKTAHFACRTVLFNIESCFWNVFNTSEYLRAIVNTFFVSLQVFVDAEC